MQERKHEVTKDINVIKMAANLLSLLRVLQLTFNKVLL